MSNNGILRAHPLNFVPGRARRILIGMFASSHHLRRLSRTGAILVLALPVFALFSLVAIVDGLVKRDLRRWGGGRESSFVYHWAKRSALPLLVLTWVIYLALPFSLHPTFIVLPFAMLFALSVAVTASTFKKYI